MALAEKLRVFTDKDGIIIILCPDVSMLHIENDQYLIVDVADEGETLASRLESMSHMTEL